MLKVRLTICLAVITLATVITTSCAPIERNARDTAAALGGLLAQAETEYAATCTSNQGQASCQLINQAVSAQNSLITAVEAYCGWTAGQVPGDPNAKCSPVKSAQAGLQTAIANSTTFITQLRGVIGKPQAPPVTIFTNHGGQ